MIANDLTLFFFLNLRLFFRVQGEDYYLTPELYTYSEMTPEKEEEFSACFDLKLIMSIYAPLCKLLGNVYMEKRMNQFPSVKSLVDQQVWNVISEVMSA